MKRTASVKSPLPGVERLGQRSTRRALVPLLPVPALVQPLAFHCAMTTTPRPLLIPPNLVAIACLLTLISFTGRGEDTEKPTALRRFVAYAWSGEPGKYDNVIPFYWLRRATLDPAKAKDGTEAMPKGHRVLFSWDLHDGLARHPEDVCRANDGTPTRQLVGSRGGAGRAAV
jgi:hypothetical protein